MKCFIALMLLFGLCVNLLECRPQNTGGGDSLILQSIFEPLSSQSNGEQIYKYSYLTSNQIEAEQTGKVDQDGENLSVKGFYSYVDPTGMQRKVSYTADQNGYRAIVEPAVYRDPTKVYYLPPIQQSIGTPVLITLGGGGLG